MLEGLGCNIIPIRDPDDPFSPDSMRVVMNFTAADCPGVMNRFSTWLCHHDANIEALTGNRQDGIYGSLVTVRVDRDRLESMMTEVNSIECNQIDMTEVDPQEHGMLYQLIIVGPDRKAIVRDITNILTRDGRRINTPSQTIRPLTHPSLPGVRLTRIEFRLEVPIDKVSSLPDVLDEIRELGRKENWHVDAREWESRLLGRTQTIDDFAFSN